MMTLYLLDGRGVFCGTQLLDDPYAALPPCALTAPPELTGTQVAQWSGTVWVVLPEYPAPLTDQQWPIVRAERNKRLAACDWTQLPDAPVDAAAWAAYRQQLRDITNQPNPFDIVWPSEPSVQK